MKLRLENIGWCHGQAWGPLAAGLLLLLADEIGNGAGNATYQGPVLVEIDAAIMVGVQVLDELVSRLPVPSVLQRNWASAIWRAPTLRANWQGHRKSPQSQLAGPQEESVCGIWDPRRTGQ